MLTNKKTFFPMVFVIRRLLKNEIVCIVNVEQGPRRYEKFQAVKLTCKKTLTNVMLWEDDLFNFTLLHENIHNLCSLYTVHTLHIQKKVFV
jgi:hypothetical protein